MFLLKEIILLCLSCSVQSITWPYSVRHSSRWKNSLQRHEGPWGKRQNKHWPVRIVTKGNKAINVYVNINIQKTKKKRRTIYQKASSRCLQHLYVLSRCKLALHSTASESMQWLPTNDYAENPTILVATVTGRDKQLALQNFFLFYWSEIIRLYLV